MTLLLFVGMFMMLVVLIQRGRGGGLAGAFGGAGGSSAFGTKAGDVFTKITIVCALVWFCLAGFSGIALRAKESRFDGGANAKTDETEDENTDAGETVPTKSAADDTKMPDLGDLPSDPIDTKDSEVPETPVPGEAKSGEAEKSGEAKKDTEKSDGEPEVKTDSENAEKSEPAKSDAEKKDNGN